jgi:hypothetical protein
MLFMAMIGLLALPESDVEADAEELDPDYDEEAFIANEIVEDGPMPTSNREWHGDWHLFGLEDELPVRNASVETRFAYDGQSITLDVLQPPDPAWIDGIEQPYKSLGSFLLVGNAARFLDGISSIADAAWLKEKERWLQKPFTFCPSCLGSNDRRPWCEMCKGRAFIDVDASEAEQHVAEEKAKRQAMIDAANAPIRTIRKTTTKPEGAGRIAA